MTNSKPILTLLLIVMLTINLFAGSIIKTKSVQTIYSDTTTTEEIIYIQDGKIRTESVEDGNRSATILDAKNGVMINIDFSDNSYTILTEDDFGKIIETFISKRDEMLAQLPEEQREMIGKMFDQQMKEMKNQPIIEYKEIGKESFNGYDCAVYHGFLNDVKTEEMWVAPWKNMKLKDKYVDVFKSIQSFFKKMTDSMGEYSGMFESDFDIELFSKGFPVKTIEYEEGNQIIIETIEDVTEADLAQSLFEIPKDFVKKDFFEL